MSQSQSSRSEGFKSKLPRPVVRRANNCGGKVSQPSVQVGKEVNKDDSKTISRLSKNESKSNLMSTKLANGPMENKLETKCDGNAHAGDTIKKEVCPPEDEFVADPRSLESILSNKGVTSKLLSNCSSASANQLQSVHRSSIYYQSPSRLSMMDSHAQFKEKMKLLKEQIKTLGIKCEGTPTSTSTAAPTSTARPVSLYYQMKPLQKKPSTPTQSTPVASRLHSMSERKLLLPKDPNRDRLCHTVSKFNTKPKNHNTQQSSSTGKENKVRFQLFSSPIHEVSENMSHGEDTTNNATTPSENKFITSQCNTVANKDHPTTDTSVSKDSELVPSQSSLSKYPPIMSASTASTWTIRNSICTPTSSGFTPVRILPLTGESVTPKRQINKNAVVMRDSPSRVLFKNESLRHKVPQRGVGAGCLQNSNRLQQRNPQHIHSTGRIQSKVLK